MDYFNKFKQAAKQGLTSLATLASDISNNLGNPNDLADERIVGREPQSSSTSFKGSDNPQADLLIQFHSVCEIIDGLAELPNANSTEGDRKLYESRAREHLRNIVLLLRKESDDWFVRYGERPDPEMVDMPCLDTFLQTHVLQALCNRATRDTPRGTLPLILSAVGSMLRNVKYPLLPHQTIHKPIAHLLSVATRYEAIYGATLGSSIAKTAKQSQGASSTPAASSDLLNGNNKLSEADFAVYKKRVELALTSLLGTVWRKISENPPILEYFTVVDLRLPKTSSSALSTAKSLINFTPQMDVLKALIELMGKQKVGPFAKEALIVSLNMHDEHVDAYLLYYTHMLEDVIVELCRRFQLLVDSLAAPQGMSAFHQFLGRPDDCVARATAAVHTATSVPQSPAGTPNANNNPNQARTPASNLNKSSNSRPSTGMSQPSPATAAIGSSNSNRPTQASDAKLTPMDAFLKALRFCNAIAQVCSVRDVDNVFVTERYPEGVESPPRPWKTTPSLKRNSDYDPEVNGDSDDDNENDGDKQEPRFRSLRYKLVTLFWGTFLHGHVKPVLLSSVDAQALACNIVLRQVLEEFRSFGTANAAVGASSGAGVTRGGGQSPLLLVTLRFLSGELFEDRKGCEEFVPLSITRCSSISKAVAVSSMHLLTTFMKSTPIEDGSLVLLHAKALSSSQTSGPTVISSEGFPWHALPSDGIASACKKIRLVVETLDMLNAETSQWNSLVSLRDGMSADGGFLWGISPEELQGNIDVAVQNVLQKICETVACGDDTGNDLMVPSLSPSNSLPLQQGNVMSVIRGLRSPQLSSATVGSTVTTSPSSVGSGSEVYGTIASVFSTKRSSLDAVLSEACALSLTHESAFLSIVHRKIDGIFSQKFDEQVVVSALVERTVRLLCAAVLVTGSAATEPGSSSGFASGADISNRYALAMHSYVDALIDLVLAIDSLWKHVLDHCQGIGIAPEKILAMRHVMQLASVHAQNSGKSAAHSAKSVREQIDPQQIKLVDKEPAQSRKIIETAILLREMYTEIQAYIYGLHQLLSQSSNPHANRDNARSRGIVGSDIFQADTDLTESMDSSSHNTSETTRDYPPLAVIAADPDFFENEDDAELMRLVFGPTGKSSLATGAVTGETGAITAMDPAGLWYALTTEFSESLKENLPDLDISLDDD